MAKSSPKGKKGKKQTTKDESPLAEDKSKRGKPTVDGKSPKGKPEKKGAKPVDDEKTVEEKTLTNDENKTSDDKNENENVSEKNIDDEPTDKSPSKKTPKKKSPKKKSPAKKSPAKKSVEHPRKRLEMGNASKVNVNKDETTEEESEAPPNEKTEEELPPKEGSGPEIPSTEKQVDSSDTPDVPLDTTDTSTMEKTEEKKIDEPSDEPSVESSEKESDIPMDTSADTPKETTTEEKDSKDTTEKSAETDDAPMDTLDTSDTQEKDSKDTTTESAETDDAPMDTSDTPTNEKTSNITDEDSVVDNKESPEKVDPEVNEPVSTVINDSIIICETESVTVTQSAKQINKVVDITDDDNSFEEGDVSSDNITESAHNLSNDEEMTVEEGDEWTVESRLESFLRWSRSHGIWMSPKVKATNIGTVHRYGMFATDDIKRGETLFVVPRALTLHPDNSRIVAEIVDYEDWLDSIGQSLDDSSGWATLLIALMLEFNDKDSYWAPYLRLVPSPEEFGHPLFWTPEEHKEELKGTTLLFDIQRDVYNIESEYKQFILPFIYRYKDICGRTERYNLSLYKRLVAFVMAYSFTEDFDTQPGMIPMADLLNHSVNNNAHLVYGEDDLKMVALKNIKKGDEIFNTFGKLGNAELLQMYGYAEKDPNIYDSLPVLVNTFLDTMEKEEKVSDSFFQAKVSLLNKTEIAPADDFFLFDRNGMRKGPDLLQMLKMLFMPEDEFEELLKSRAGNRPDSFYQKLLRKLKLARKTDTSSGVAIIDITDEEPEHEPPPKRKIVDLQDCEEIEDNEPPTKFPRGLGGAAGGGSGGGGNEMNMMYLQMQGHPEQNFPLNMLQKQYTSFEKPSNGNSKTNAIVIDDSDEESNGDDEEDEEEEGEDKDEGKKEEGVVGEKSVETSSKVEDTKSEEEKEKECTSSETKGADADDGEKSEEKDDDEEGDAAKDSTKSSTEDKEKTDTTKDDTSKESKKDSSTEKSKDKDSTEEGDKVKDAEAGETKSESTSKEKKGDAEESVESKEASPKEKGDEVTDKPSTEESDGKVNGDINDVVSIGDDIEDNLEESESRDSDVDDIEIVSEDIRCKMTYANLNTELKPEWRDFIKKVLQAVLVGIKDDADMSTSEARETMSDREFFSYQVRQGQRSIVKTFIASLVT